MNKNTKLILLSLYLVFAITLVWFLKLTYLPSLLIIFYIPALINFLWLQNNRLKILFFSFLALIFFAPPVELLGRGANVWQVQTIFPQLLGLLPLENFLFAFINFFWVLCFYEYFSADNKPYLISKKIWALLGLYWLMDFFVFVYYINSDNFSGLNYHWLALPILVIPFVFIFYNQPKLLPKTIKTTLFFFFLLFSYELIALLLCHWWWPGNYLLPLDFFGNIFPLDDVIIWHLLSTPVLIGGYEYFYKKI